MKVYFVRHGESQGNLEVRHQGSDEKLTTEGKNQAKLVSERLKNKKIEVIYSSPYVRAKQTAEGISKNIGVKIEYWETLRERNLQRSKV